MAGVHDVRPSGRVRAQPPLGAGGGFLRSLALVAVIAGGAVGCGDGGVDAPDENEPGLANPASEFCVEQGGEVEIVDEGDGQVGYCVLPDGRRIEEWEFYRAETGLTTEP